VTEDHRFTDEFPMAEGFAENVEFFTMTYGSPRTVAHIGIWPIRDPSRFGSSVRTHGYGNGWHQECCHQHPAILLLATLTVADAMTMEPMGTLFIPSPFLPALLFR
jgi:hypothetical protein